jgi:hypothetical protein
MLTRHLELSTLLEVTVDKAAKCRSAYNLPIHSKIKGVLSHFPLF